MAKIQMTRVEINRLYKRVYRYNISTLHPLYDQRDATGYNCGVYGWNFNVYQVTADICILSGDRCILQGAYFQRADNIHARNAHFQALKDEVKKRNFKAYSVSTTEILPDGTIKKVDKKQVDILPICRIGYKYIGG